MKTSLRAFAIVAAFGAVLWGGCLMHNKTVSSASGLPQDVLQSCTLSRDSFTNWFVNHKVTENGAVSPANSVTFQPNDNCNFYQWSQQMFLWLMSPAQGAYGNSGNVMESPVFYDVSPPDASGTRKLIPHVAGTPIRMDSHLLKDGPDRLPVVRDTKGRLVEVENALTAPEAKKLVSTTAGSVAVDHVAADNKGGFTFFDATGKAIDHPKALIAKRHPRMRIVHQFAAGEKFVLLDADGNVTQSEEGQATGDVLRAQNGSLVYYVTMVNDVYATYLDATRSGVMSSATFPTTAGARDSLTKIARSHHKVLPDSNALAMELKTSWVEASGLKDPQNYITMDAVIPTYDTTNNKLWKPTGNKTTKMALVGIHVVGSVAGHPEMVWATFEHNKNTPNAAYQYVNSANQVKTVPQDTGKGWLFTANAADGSPNVSHAGVLKVKHIPSDTIYAKNKFTISPSNTQRLMPWGSAMDSVTNQQDKSSAASNSEIISINNTIQRFLVGNDIRKNYLLIGATWTFGGAAPNGNTYGSDTTHGVSIGTNVLSNSTMETYLQLSSTSCFTCHSGSSPSLNPDSISHVFGELSKKVKATYLIRKK